MSDDARTVVTRWNDAFMRGDFDELATLIHDDFVDHSPYPGMGTDKAAFLEKARVSKAATPDVVYRLVDQVAEGDRIVDRFEVTATPVGDLLGIPANGKTVTFTLVDFLRIKDGKVIENWFLADAAALMAQLGVGAG
jgi:steroid delta-isomerase-like uncharacterized protein